MSSLSDEQKSKVVQLIRAGDSSNEIAEKLGVNLGSVRSIRANFTMGRYAADSDEEEEIVDSVETKFGLERDLQLALRNNIEQLEEGLTIIDDGKEYITVTGRIDVLAADATGATVVIELKAGEARPDVVAQTLGYIGAIQEERGGVVRGIIVASQFPTRVVYAAKAVANLRLCSYKINFTFTDALTTCEA